MKSGSDCKEDAVIHRSRCAVSETTKALKMLGVYQTVVDEQGNCERVELEPTQRRELLVFLSELEELMKELEDVKSEVARDIEKTNRNVTAAAAYRSTGVSVRKYARQGRP
jgi:hypothetical protein